MLKFLRELALHSCYEQLINFPVLLHNTIRILETSSSKELLISALNFIKCLKGKID